jgi:agmatine/peptidylarginine deiminase
MRFSIRAAAFAAILAACCFNAVAPAADPVIVGDELVFPEGAEIPRSLTETERKYLQTHPRLPSRAVTPPPTGQIRCVAEYEPMDGILMSWEAFTTTLTAMSADITNNAGADVYMVVDTTGEQSTATTALTSGGVNMSRVKFVVRTTDSVWIRDYGPRYIYQGQCRAIIDHDYNRPRPNDDLLPSYFSTVKHHAYYEHQLIHGGGNFHLNALGRSFVTKLIVNENPGLTQAQIHGIWQSYQNVDTHFFDPFPTTVDATQHIDMWMQVIADDRVVISDWPSNSGSAQDIICDDAAVYMASQGFTVYRVPARSISGVHYTYTNMVMCNNRVLLPSYTLAGMSAHNTEALNAMNVALAGTGKTVVQIPNCDPIAQLAGVIHCIVMHVPRHLGAAGPAGGLAPTAWLRNFRGGEVVPPAVPGDILWITDDDVSVSNVDLLLSTDGGQTFDTVLAAATVDDGAFSWTPPNVFAPHARLRVVARDGLGNTGSDESPADFTINGAPVLGDMNCDARLTTADTEQFIQALLDASAFTGCDIDFADMNGDGRLDALDAAAFADALVP